MRLSFIAFLLIYLLSACGVKGPLYLPQTNEANQASSNNVEKNE